MYEKPIVPHEAPQKIILKNLCDKEINAVNELARILELYGSKIE